MNNPAFSDDRLAWARVKKGAPCPICGKPDWCEVSKNGEIALCMRTESDKPSRNGGWIHRLNGHVDASLPSIESKPYKEHDRASSDNLDKVYRAFLALLSLSSYHKAHLEGRKLTQEQIQRHAYNTLPEKGRCEIARKLLKLFGLEIMETIPGFMVMSNGKGSYPTFAGQAGILIPIKNPQEQIVGLQIRLDNLAQDSARYKWFSSANRTNGTSSGSPAHVAKPLAKKGNQIWITEGALKANIAVEYLGQLCIGVAGVSNWQSGRVLDILHTLQAVEVVIAYDADAVEKPEVRLQRDILAKACTLDGYQVFLATWPLEKGKGIDDLLVGGSIPQVQPWQDKEHSKGEESTIAKIFKEPELAMVVPPDWLLTEQGISQIKYKPNGEFLSIHTSHYPIIITAIAKNIDEGTEHITLKYKKEGKIYTLTADRKTLSEQRSITQISENGFPVNSVNAKQIIRYLEDFEATNIACLKKISITHGFGHKYDSKGNCIYYLPDKTYNSDELVSFYGRGPGDNEFFKALQPKGSLSDWVLIIKSYCVEHNRVMFQIYTSFAAPLLRPFGCSQSFATQSQAISSSGKTTANEAAASVFGNPAKLMLQWNHITQVAAEQLAGLCNGIPIFLEDSQNADEKKISTMIYLIANSVGKARGYKSGGLQRTLSWLTILFSTGEQKLFDVTRKGGAEARTISFWGSPFGTDKEMGKKVRELKRLVHQTYGCAIRPFLDYVYSLTSEQLMKYYEDAYKVIESKLTNTGDVHRYIDYFACVLAAGMIAEEVFHFGKSPLEVVQDVLEQFQQEGMADAVSEAMEDTISWINSNDNLYDISGKTQVSKESGARHGVKSPGEYIAVLPHILKDFLVKQGYSYSMVLKVWKDRGWIHGDKRNFTCPVSFRGINVRMIKIPWKVYTSQCNTGQ